MSSKKVLQKVILLIIILIHITIFTGCWNYREIDDLSIVAGVAIDYADEQKTEYELTVEVVKTKSTGNQTEIVSEVISHKGKTVFDAIRNMIGIAEKKLYWSHAKVFIISEEVAKKSIIPIIDWIFRDAETRQDMMLVVSKEKKAGDILRSAEGKTDVLSIKIYEMIEFQEQLSKAPIIPFWKIAKDLNEDTVCSAIPLIHFIKQGDKQEVHVGGTAVFRDNRMIGELSEEETKYYLFAKNQVKGGIIPVTMKHGDMIINISLEIYDNVTKIKFDGSNKDRPGIEIDLHTRVFIGEVGGDMDPTEHSMLKGIERLAKEDLEKNILKVCNKALKEYKSDIFGFAKCIKDSDPNLWREYSKKYLEVKPDIDIKVNAKVTVVLSGLLRKDVPIR